MLLLAAAPVRSPRPTQSDHFVDGNAEHFVLEGGSRPLETPFPPLPPCVDDRHNQQTINGTTQRGTLPLGDDDKYYVNVASLPSGLTPDVAWYVKAGFQTWNAELNDCGRPSTSTFAFRFSGTTDRVPSLVRRPGVSPIEDGFNDVGFIDLSDYAPVTGNQVVGVAAVKTEPDPPYRVLEFDIGLSEDTEWDTFEWIPVMALDLLPDTNFPFEPTAYDVWNVVAHEVGHVIGIAHTGGDANTAGMLLTMYFLSWPGDLGKRTLGLGDMLALEERSAERLDYATP